MDPFSGLVQHWVGLFHAIARTIGVLAAWVLWPDHRFVVIPGVIVVIYLVTIAILVRDFPQASAKHPSAATV